MSPVPIFTNHYGAGSMMHTRLRLLTLACISLCGLRAAPAESERDFAAALRALDSRSLPPAERARASGMLARWIDGLFLEAARREDAPWKAVSTRAEWERFRDRRLAALRESLGTPRANSERPRVRVTRRLRGDGYKIENLMIETQDTGDRAQGSTLGTAPV